MGLGKCTCGSKAVKLRTHIKFINDKEYIWCDFSCAACSARIEGEMTAFCNWISDWGRLSEGVTRTPHTMLSEAARRYILKEHAPVQSRVLSSYINPREGGHEIYTDAWPRRTV